MVASRANQEANSRDAREEYLESYQRVVASWIEARLLINNAKRH